MNKMYAKILIYELFLKTDGDGILLIPGFDSAASHGEVMDTGRIIRCVFSWNEKEAMDASEEFGELAESLFEIGDWYANSGADYGVRPDEEFMANSSSMKIWEKYIAGETSDLLGFMMNRYCKLSAVDAPEPVLSTALKELSYAFVIKRFAKKAERIDMLMDERESRSFFPEYKSLLFSDFRRIVVFLSEEQNIQTKKAGIFRALTETDEETKKLYNDLFNMDI